MYIQKKWLILTSVIVLGVAISYIYIQFFQSNHADEVCCTKHYIQVPPVLTISESTPIPILDSSKANQQITYNILNQVQEGLMRLGPNDIPVPGLAESYQVSPDYRTYTFTIRKNAVWSDGKPVTANDFKYAWERALNPANEYELAYLFYPIQNAKAYFLGKVEKDQIGITAKDDNHLIINLDKPDTNFLSLVTLSSFFPIRSDLVDKYEDNYGTSAAPESLRFTGPYKITSFSPAGVYLEKNTKYWDQKNVHLKKVSIKVEVDPIKRKQQFNSELISLIKTDYQYIKVHEKKNLKVAPKAISDFLVLNQQKDSFKNIKIRKSTQLAINNKEIASLLPGETSYAKTLIPPVLKIDNQKTYQSNFQLMPKVNEAENLLKNGLGELGESHLKPLRLITTENNLRLVTLANQVKEQLTKLGLEIIIEKYPIKQKAKMLSNGDYDIAISEWSAEYHDPSIFLFIGYSNTSDNVSSFSDPHYDSLINKASMETNPAKRDQLLQQAERYLIVDQAVIAPLVYVNDLRLQKSYVKNVLYHPFGADYSLKWATYQPPKQIEATK